MVNLPTLQSLEVEGKTVLVRADLDVNLSEELDIFRLRTLLPTIEHLQGKGAKIVLLGHRGRPEGKHNPELSLKPVSEKLEELLKKEKGEEWLKNLDMQMMENLRFDKGEEGNDPEYARHLATKGDCFVNEAFSASHREHASIVGLPKLLPSAAGLRFVQETEKLGSVLENPEKPVIAIIAGVKEDKLSYVEGFEKFADKVLIGGRLPAYIDDNHDYWIDRKIQIASLNADKEDLTIHSIEVFEAEISRAGTIILTGPLGKYEEEGHRIGTQRILQAIADSSAKKIAGGGDTQKAISFFGLEDRFDWISVGGGAALEYLANSTLPGIEALQKQDA